MKVRLLLFAVLRDIIGSSETEIEIAAGTRVFEVWNDLRSCHQELSAYVNPPMTAVNETYVDPATELHDGDELAFVPPVSGGH